MSSKVRFQVLTDKTFRPPGGDFVIRVALKMGISDLAETLPLHICLVIDRSMSMTGIKLEEARQSARNLIMALGKGDRISIITFSTGADVIVDRLVIEDTSRDQAVQAVDGITAGGVTRLDLALEEGYRLLASDGGESMPMMLLISDGAPTNQNGFVLEDDAMIILQDTMGQAGSSSHITTSAIGLGNAEDCLAPFLEGAAERGGGVFYHEDNPAHLVDRFMEEFHRVQGTAVAGARFHVTDVLGKVRRAAAILPDVRDIAVNDEAGITLEAGSLQKGEEHVFLLEIVTPENPELVKKKLCEVAVSYRLEGQEQHLAGEPQLVEYTDDEMLIDKPGHADVEKYKAMYMAFVQTQKAASNLRSGGDAKKTKMLLQSAAKTTKRLGMARQTKLLNDMVQQLDQPGSVSENQLTEVTTASRKTKVLSRPGSST